MLVSASPAHGTPPVRLQAPVPRFRPSVALRSTLKSRQGNPDAGRRKSVVNIRRGFVHGLVGGFRVTIQVPPVLSP